MQYSRTPANRVSHSLRNTKMKSLGLEVVTAGTKRPFQPILRLQFLQNILAVLLGAQEIDVQPSITLKICILRHGEAESKIKAMGTAQ